MLQLLGRRVVLVVLVAPPGARHAAAHAVNKFLEGAVDRNLARQRVVARLVHEPAAAARGEAQQDDARGRVSGGEDEVGADDVHEHDLADPVDDLAPVRVEAALAGELLPQPGVASREIGPPVSLARVEDVAGRRDLGQAPQHRLGLLGAPVELLERFRGVAVIREKLDDGPAGVLERRDVVQVAADEDVGRRLLLRLAHVRRGALRALAHDRDHAGTGQLWRHG